MNRVEPQTKHPWRKLQVIKSNEQAEAGDTERRLTHSRGLTLLSSLNSRQKIYNSSKSRFQFDTSTTWYRTCSSVHDGRASNLGRHKCSTEVIIWLPACSGFHSGCVDRDFVLKPPKRQRVRASFLGDATV